MATYFNTLPVELNTEIISYLEYDDLLKFEASFGNLKIDWFHLFLIRYPLLHNLNIKSSFLPSNDGKKDLYDPQKFNVEILYKDLLRSYLYVRSEEDKEKFYYTFQMELNYDNYIAKETWEYLLKNNFITPSVHLIAKVDDVKMFMKFREKIDIYEYKYFLHSSERKKYEFNILKYIFNDKDLLKLWLHDDQLWSDLINGYGSFRINLETTKIVINNLNNHILDNHILFRLYNTSQLNDSNISEYILNAFNLDEQISKIDIIYTLRSIYAYERDNTYETFMKVYHKFFKTDIDIPVLIKVLSDSHILFNRDTSKDQHKIIKFLENEKTI